MHHPHQAQHLQVWRNLLYLCTVAAALILYRATRLGLLGSIIVGFLISAAILRCAHGMIRSQNRKG